MGAIGLRADREPGPPLHIGQRLGVLGVLPVRPWTGRRAQDVAGSGAGLVRTAAPRPSTGRGLVAEFDGPAHWEVTSMLAVGQVLPPVEGPLVGTIGGPAGSVTAWTRSCGRSAELPALLHRSERDGPRCALAFSPGGIRYAVTEHRPRWHDPAQWGGGATRRGSPSSERVAIVVTDHRSRCGHAQVGGRDGELAWIGVLGVSG